MKRLTTQTGFLSIKLYIYLKKFYIYLKKIYLQKSYILIF